MDVQSNLQECRSDFGGLPEVAPRFCCINTGRVSVAVPAVKIVKRVLDVHFQTNDKFSNHYGVMTPHRRTVYQSAALYKVFHLTVGCHSSFVPSISFIVKVRTVVSAVEKIVIGALVIKGAQAVSSLWC